MKKTIVTGVTAIIMLFVTSTVFAKTNNLKTNAASATEDFSMSFNSQRQTLNIKQSVVTKPVQVTITNDRGSIVYTGKVINGDGNINMTGVATGKYDVQLQDGTSNTLYKLLIL